MKNTGAYEIQPMTLEEAIEELARIANTYLEHPLTALWREASTQRKHETESLLQEAEKIIETVMPVLQTNIAALTERIIRLEKLSILLTADTATQERISIKEPSFDKEFTNDDDERKRNQEEIEATLKKKALLTTDRRLLEEAINAIKGAPENEFKEPMPQ